MRKAIQNFLGALAVLSVFFPQLTYAAADMSGEFVAELGKGWRQYHSGNVIDAIKHFDSLINSSKNDLEKARALEQVLQICRQTSDSLCFDKFIEQSIRISKQAKIDAGEANNSDLITKYKVLPSTREEAVNIVAITAMIAMMNAEDVDNKVLESIKNNSITAFRMTPEYGDIYVDLQLELAETLSSNFSFAEARVTLDRALSFLLSADNPNQYSTARWLAEIIKQYAESADTVRAIMLYRAAGNFVPNALANSIPEYVKFRIAEASLLQGIGDFKGSLAAAESAIKGIDFLNVQPWQKEHLLSVATNDAIASNILLGDIDAAKRFLSQHPFRNKRDFSDKTIASYQTFTRYVLFGMMLEGKDSLDVKKYIDYLGGVATTHPSYTVLAPLLQGFAAPPPSPERLKHLIAAGEAMVVLSNKILEENEDAAYLPESSERFVLGLALEALARSDLPESVKAAKALPMMEILGRSLRTIEADAVEVIARQPTETARREAHSRMRLSAGQAAAQRDGVKQLVDRLSSEQPHPMAMTYNGSERWPYSRIGIERERLREISGKNSIRRPPDLPSLQKTLREGEVYIHSQGTSANSAVHLCVSKTRAWYSRSDYSPDELSSALSRLNEALDVSSGSLPPLSSFPFNASLSLFNAFVKPVAPCLDSANHLIWRNSSDRIHFPVSLLLDSLPASGTDELNIPWFGRKYAISNVQSATSIIATRIRPRSRDFDGIFLGIGDPKFSSSPGDRSETSVLRNVSKRRDGASVVLEELPETRDELLGIAKGLPERKNVLLREHATESKVRQQPLGTYRWINFATHGVIREEIPGLKDAALVLSSGAPQGSRDDGLLTSSEIADLRLGADFVALSACNTANFDVSDASSEVAGLTTAFSIAGVPATLATLQPVDSYVAKEIVTRTFQNAYKHLQPPAHALHAAVNDYLASEKDVALRHPAYWSAFIVQGDGGSHPSERGSATLDRYLIDEGSFESSGGNLLYLTKEKELYETYSTVHGENTNATWFLRKLDPMSLDVVWSKKLEGGFNQGRLIKVGQSLVVGGFLYPEGSDHIVPVINAYSRDGRLLWQRKPTNSEYSKGVVSSLTTIGKNLLAIVWWADADLGKSGNDEKRFKRQIQLVEFDPNGREVRSATVPLWPGLAFPTTKVAVSSQKIALFMGETKDFGDQKVFRNLYSDMDFCNPNYAGKYVLLDRLTLKIATEKYVPGVVFKDIIATGGDEFLAAVEIRNNCQSLPSAAAVVKLRRDGGIEEFWSQKGPFGGSATALAIKGNEIYVTGNESRSVAMHNLRAKKVASKSTDSADWENQALGEVFVTRLDSQGKQRSINWLTSGTYYYASDIAIAGEQILLNGTAGNNAMRIRATLSGTLDSGK